MKQQLPAAAAIIISLKISRLSCLLLDWLDIIFFLSQKYFLVTLLFDVGFSNIFLLSHPCDRGNFGCAS
jgi:hypothetical protein